MVRQVAGPHGASGLVQDRQAWVVLAVVDRAETEEIASWPCGITTLLALATPLTLVLLDWCPQMRVEKSLVTKP